MKHKGPFLKYTLLFFLTLSALLADLKELNSYQAAFKQVVTDEDNITITYSGMFYAKKPYFTLWRYDSPVPKSVYINHTMMAIIEPELEQVITRKYNKKFSLFKMLTKAKKIDAHTYKKVIDGKHYTLKVSGDRIETLSYYDDFDNHVKISFSAQKPDPKLPNNFFRIRYPQEYDMVSE